MIATLPIGYADGLNRKLSNRGSVLIGGKRCPIVGTVCMDMIMVDVSEVPAAKVYDEAVIIGSRAMNKSPPKKSPGFSIRFRMRCFAV